MTRNHWQLQGRTSRGAKVFACLERLRDTSAFFDYHAESSTISQCNAPPWVVDLDAVITLAFGGLAKGSANPVFVPRPAHLLR